jgi:DNA topoisomerase-1
VSDAEPGLSRIAHRAGFIYRDRYRRAVRDRRTLDRIRSLAIPPAWTQVWISPRPDGHLQATGRDARGRKQYRYHPDWTSVRTDGKYDRTMEFGMILPAIRRRVSADLQSAPLSREYVLATVVRLLERTLIRIGNGEYARANKSFGLTTLLDEHVHIDGPSMTFHFRAKSGVMQTVSLTDAKLAAIVAKCRRQPGRALFQYVDGHNRRQCVDSQDVNAYLRKITGKPFTAKDFRTWAGTVQAAIAACGLPPAISDAGFRRHMLSAVDLVAAKLGNTRAVCRKSYIHPAVFDAYRVGQTIAAARKSSRAGLASTEAAVLSLLKRHSQQKAA